MNTRKAIGILTKQQCRLTPKEMKKAKAILRREWKEFVAYNYINNPKIKTIILVGSRATGKCRIDSDADFKIILDKVPTHLHVNPKTGEKTYLQPNKGVVTVDFTHYIDGSDKLKENVFIDPFIVYNKQDKTYYGT